MFNRVPKATNPHVASVDIGSGRFATVHAQVDPVALQADVSIVVNCEGRALQIETDWNELLNSNGPIVYEHDGISVLLTEGALNDLDTATWQLLSAQGLVPTEWCE